MEYTLKNQKVTLYNPVHNTTSEEFLITKLDTWTVLFFYPSDFSVVCPTELEALSKLYQEFSQLGANILVISRDSQYTHKSWIENDERLKDFPIEMVSDIDGDIAKIFPFPLINATSKAYERATIILDRKGAIQYIEVGSSSIGRNVEEYLRKIKALEYVKHNKGALCQEGRNDTQTGIKDTITHTTKKSSFSQAAGENSC